MQTVAGTNNRTSHSGTHGFTEAKRALLTKVMVLLRPNAMGGLKVHNNNYLLRNNNIQQSLIPWRHRVSFETTRILRTKFLPLNYWGELLARQLMAINPFPAIPPSSVKTLHIHGVMAYQAQ